MAAGSEIEGAGTNNVLNAAGDLSEATITGVSSLRLEGDLTLTAAQFSAFTTVTGNATIDAATSGTYSLADNSSDSQINLAADASGGTTLIGNDAYGETLTASTGGNDTLIGGNGDTDTLIAGEGDDTLNAGNGFGDALVAGAGVDTLTGGSGSFDTFVADNGLAAGSTVTGGSGGGNRLETNGDITDVSISGIQTLLTSDITLTSAQSNQFTAIQDETSGSGNGNIYAATGGTYAPVANFNMTALSSDGTILNSRGDDVVLTASKAGNDTLYLYYGTDDTLDASYSTGNDVIYANTNVETATNVIAYLQYSKGMDKLDFNYGVGDKVYAEFSEGDDNYSIDGNNNTLDDQYSTGNETITSSVDPTLAPNSNIFNLQYSSGSDNINVNGNNDEINMQYSSGSITAQIGGSYNLVDDQYSTGDENITCDYGSESNSNFQESKGNNNVYLYDVTYSIVDESNSTGQFTFSDSDSHNNIIYTGLGVQDINYLDAHDAVVVSGKIASGSHISGDNDDDILEGSGDITNAQVTGFSTLIATGVLTLTTAELDEFGTITLTPGAGQLIVSDTAANISAALDTLEADVADIQSISLSDAGTPVLDVTQAQVTNDASAIAKIVSPYELSVACYCPGTLILTDRGEVPVERLATGEIVVTAAGEAKPIKWIGHRALNCSRHPDPKDVWPIRVSAGAFGENKPSRDLWLSPGHNIAAEGVLMPIKALQNGKTVVQQEQSTVEYWHIELDEHDIIIAEGLPAESYLDTGNRTAFVNGGAFIEAYPDFKPKHWAATCAPLVFEGAEVTRTKAMLLERLKAAGHELTSRSDLHIIADGKRIEPLKLATTSFAFRLPPRCKEIRLASRSFIPAHVFAESTDTRSLGICAGRLQIDGEDIALNADMLRGDEWHETEAGLRWTRGAVTLPPKTRLVVIDLAGPGHYWQEREDSREALYA